MPDASTFNLGPYVLIEYEKDNFGVNSGVRYDYKRLSSVDQVLDLDYDEDSQAETDANFVLTNDDGIVEVQATAEGAPYSQTDLHDMLDLARKGVNALFQHQLNALDLPVS